MGFAPLDLYCPPILLVVGLACNTVVIWVMRKKFFCGVSTSTYISFNALIDILSLMLALPVHWMHVNFPETIYRGDNSDAICKVLHFIGWLTSDLGIILTAAMTLERAIAVKYPLKAAALCTVKRAKLTIAVLVLAMVLKDGHVVVQSRLAKVDVESRMCELDLSNSAYKYFNDVIWTNLHNAFLLVSFITIGASNVIIIKTVQASRSFPSFPSQASVRVSAKTKTASVRGRQLTVMLISDSVTIVICTLPFAIYTTVCTYVYVEESVDHVVFSVCFYLLYVNRCANFFLYCISGERFRQALLEPCRSRESRSDAAMTVYTVDIRSNDISDI